MEALEQACKSCHHVVTVLLSSNLEMRKKLEYLEGVRPSEPESHVRRRLGR